MPRKYAKLMVKVKEGCKANRLLPFSETEKLGN